MPTTSHQLNNPAGDAGGVKSSALVAVPPAVVTVILPLRAHYSGDLGSRVNSESQGIRVPELDCGCPGEVGAGNDHHIALISRGRREGSYGGETVIANDVLRRVVGLYYHRCRCRGRLGQELFQE